MSNEYKNEVPNNDVTMSELSDNDLENIYAGVGKSRRGNEGVQGRTRRGSGGYSSTSSSSSYSSRSMIRSSRTMSTRSSGY